MSIQKISPDTKTLEARRTVVVTQALGNVYGPGATILISGVGANPFQINLQQYQIDFIPTRMVLRQVSYVNLVLANGDLGADQGIWTLYCSASRQPMAFVTVNPLNITATTEQVINLPTYNPIIEFQVVPTGSSSNFNIITPIPSFAPPTGFIAMSLEFF